MKNPAVDDLHNPSRFRLLEELRYDSIIPFVFKNIGHATRSGIIYRFVNIFLGVFVLGFSIYGFRAGVFSGGPYFKILLWAILSGTVVVIPLHEGIHAAAYKLSGAPRVFFGMDLKQMLFYVSTDNYVVDRKQFYFVALSPFVFINAVSILVLFFSGPYGFLFISVFLFLHNLMCIGDFAMVSFFEKKKDRKLYTYDKHGERISYIFEELEVKGKA